ncbi:hypothetical protein AeRB84_016543 [Aphanomyces euteiches]|nr:hypothetical protein AeRB84_016543 [Aphanomyces euteiches]
MEPATLFFAAPVQAQVNVPYAYPSPYAPGFQLQPTPPSTNPVAVPTTTQPPGPSRSRPRTDFVPVMITSKPDDMTTSGVKVCGRCDRLGHGAEDCPRSSSVATCVTKSATTLASMFEPAPSASKSATVRRVAPLVQPTRLEIAAPGRLLRKQDTFWYARLNTFPTCPRQMHLILLTTTLLGDLMSRHTTQFLLLDPSERTQSDRPIFTDDEITDLMESHLEFPEEEYSKEIEDRLYPITKSDVRKQLERIRKRQINPTHEEILRSLDLSEADSHLLLAPADIEDETLWLKWFADTLEKCDEARRASRDFNNTRKHPLARVSWIDPNPYAVLDMDDLTDVAERSDGEDSGSTSLEDEKLPSDCVTYLPDIPLLCSGVRRSEDYKCSDEFWKELPLDCIHTRLQLPRLKLDSNLNNSAVSIANPLRSIGLIVPTYSKEIRPQCDSYAD